MALSIKTELGTFWPIVPLTFAGFFFFLEEEEERCRGEKEEVGVIKNTESEEYNEQIE